MSWRWSSPWILSRRCHGWCRPCRRCYRHRVVVAVCVAVIVRVVLMSSSPSVLLSPLSSRCCHRHVVAVDLGVSVTVFVLVTTSFLPSTSPSCSRPGSSLPSPSPSFSPPSCSSRLVGVALIAVALQRLQRLTPSPSLTPATAITIIKATKTVVRTPRTPSATRHRNDNDSNND